MTDTLPVALLLLLDSRSPAGAHGHSSGMESAVSAGWVRTAPDVAEFCRLRLRASGRTAAAFAATAFRDFSNGAGPAGWQQLDAEFSARTPSEATRSASRTLGGGLRRLLLASAPDQADRISEIWSECPPPAPHHPLVLGVATALAGGSDRAAARAALLMACTGPASAAVRLLGLDPYAIHRILIELAAEIEGVADEAATLTTLPAAAAPALDLLADVHSRSKVRLFAS